MAVPAADALINVKAVLADNAFINVKVAPITNAVINVTAADNTFINTKNAINVKTVPANNAFINAKAASAVNTLINTDLAHHSNVTNCPPATKDTTCHDTPSIYASCPGPAHNVTAAHAACTLIHGNLALPSNLANCRTRQRPDAPSVIPSSSAPTCSAGYYPAARSVCAPRPVSVHTITKTPYNQVDHIPYYNPCSYPMPVSQDFHYAEG